MADNVAITAGTGTTIAADDIAGVMYQRVKIAHGADGSATDVSSASPIPATLTNLERAEDAAHSTGHTGIMPLAVRVDAIGALSGTTGDYNPFQLDANGELRTVAAGYMTRVQTSKTRPGDTTTYAAGEVVNESDSVGTCFTFNSCSRIVAGSGVITRASISASNNGSTKGIFELWLFNAAPAAAGFDNAVFTPSDAELLNMIGIIQFSNVYIGDAQAAASGNSFYSSGQISLPFITGAATRDIYGILVVRNAYVPVASETFGITLTISQD